ncbi:3-oxoacyl-[acyl-carrier protein] reductase [Rhodoligotrophos appendicifer]|uniref:SDR family NAD(P)-dependent oxidoreductase n=1 Tax=Rhodoligotrophos appendicifer TaxID=987056 RepID=UPI00117C472A|nr:glucose 1-dehydrogenase [Rhodoligotrophos appendicifer]
MSPVSGRRPVAVVTGGARGIGRACVLALAAKGFDVGVVDLLAEAAEATAQDARGLGADAIAVQADVTDLAASLHAASAIRDRLGGIDVLVNNAGRTMGKGLMEISEEEWSSTIDVNLKSCFCWCRAVTPIMRAHGAGRIINMASLNAITGGVTSAVSKFAYAAAKGGVLSLTKSLAKELGPEIVVNAICPGIIKTELTAGLIAAREEELSAGITLRRLGVPEDIAAVVVFLATVEPNFMTGQHLVVDGGQWVT